MNIETYPRKIFEILLCIIFSLVIINVIGIISKFYFGHGNVYGLVPLFDLNTEKNIPTLYSSITLLISCILLAIIAIAHKRNGSAYFSWLGLAVIFLFLSIDEIAVIHERLRAPVHYSLSTTGLLYYSWFIPYGGFLIVLVLAYFKFLMRLPKKIMILFVVSGVTFVSGAIGFESLSGRHDELFGNNNLIYSFYYTCEESLEMLGVAIFIYALLMYILIKFKSFTRTVKESK